MFTDWTRLPGRSWLPCDRCVNRPKLINNPARCSHCNGEGVTEEASQGSNRPEHLRRLVLALVKSTEDTSLAMAAESLAFKLEQLVLTGQTADSDGDRNDIELF
jgi:hypothetical protein